MECRLFAGRPSRQWLYLHQAKPAKIHTRRGQATAGQHLKEGHEFLDMRNEAADEGGPVGESARFLKRASIALSAAEGCHTRKRKTHQRHGGRFGGAYLVPVGRR